MAKLDVEYTTDYKGISCIRISKKKGKLSYKEVYEELERRNLAGLMLIQIMQIREEIPEDLYEEGDVWVLYEPWDIVPDIITYQGGIDIFPREHVEKWKETLLGGK